MIIYPAIDLMGGRCVRLTQGAFESEKVYSSDPAAVLAGFKQAGAGHVHVVDLDGAKDPERRQTDILEKLAGTSGLKIQAGGGVRAAGDIERLLAAGADRVVVGTLAVEDPDLFATFLSRFGGERLTLALDVFVGAEGPRVASRGWSQKTGISADELIVRFLKAGLRRALCTDIAKDGMLMGPNVELYRQLALSAPRLELQASGGVRDLSDLQALKATSVHSAIVGKALYEGTLDLAQAIERC